jgi:thioredoxin-like negative regulator of GroEL
MGILGLCMMAGAHREAPLVGHKKLGSEVSQLENTVAAHPEDGDALFSLSRSYLERGSPGLALAALDRAPEPVRQSARIAHLRSVALLHEGRASEALVSERAVIASCEKQHCAPWLLASALRHEQFLAELVEQGVEDYKRDPDATEIASRKLSRNVVAILDHSAQH